MRARNPILSSATVAAVSLAIGVSSQAAELVNNGSFTSGSLGWTVVPATSGSDICFNCVGPGVNFGAVGTVNDEVYQTLNTIAGDSYKISFTLTQPGSSNTPNDLIANFGSANLLTLNNLDLANITIPFSFTETATSNHTVLAFYGLNVPAWNDVTDVSVQGNVSPTPIPGAFLLFGSCLTGLAAYSAARRRKTG